ncbi:hypothetical protein ASC82_25815 [Streptomyces sp. Root431]|nr:hypothetical protein ASC82_25815 [Streptomyces sp. Root431]
MRLEDQIERVGRDLVQAEIEDIGGGAEVDAGDFGAVVVPCGEVEMQADRIARGGEGRAEGQRSTRTTAGGA